MRYLSLLLPIMFALWGCGNGDDHTFHDGRLSWVVQAGGMGFDAGHGISGPSSSSLITIGSAGGGAVFGMGEPNMTDLARTGPFLASYNEDGSLNWARSTGGPTNSISALSDGSSIGTGVFNYETTFGIGDPNETVLTPIGSVDSYNVRYNPNGTLAWVSHEGSFDDISTDTDISASPDGSFVVTSHFGGNATLHFGKPDELFLSSVGDKDIIVARYTSDGTLDWVVQSGGLSSSVYSRSISSSSNGSSAVAGDFNGSIKFNSIDSNEIVVASGGSDGMFIVKYNSEGLIEWVRTATGTASVFGTGVSISDTGFTAVVGRFSGVLTFGVGDPNETTLTSLGVENLFISRYNSNGELAWARRSSGTGFLLASSVSILRDGSVILAGSFEGESTFGIGGPEETTLVSAGETDVFIARYSSSGTLDWARRAGGEDYEFAEDISLLSDGTSSVIGMFYGEAVFGPGEENETTLTAYGEEDIFIMHLNK